MSIGDHMKEFGGLPAFTFPDLEPDEPKKKKKNKPKPLPEADAVAWRVGVATYETTETWAECFARFAATVDLSKVSALIIGTWDDVYDNGPDAVISTLIDARDRLPALRALFLGDITYEECEISWINQTQVAPLLEAFPELETFGVRGGQSLGFSAVRHQNLRTLVMEAGGLPGDVVRGVAASDLPALRHLDLWLGTTEYGGEAEVADLAPIFSGDRLPALTHLALRNSDIQDTICAGLAAAPVVARLTSLDVSMGVLTDDGAAALLSGQPLSHLDALDMHHNYLSQAMCERLREALEPAAVSLALDRGRAEEADDEDDDEDVWRFVAVGE